MKIRIGAALAVLLFVVSAGFTSAYASTGCNIGVHHDVYLQGTIQQPCQSGDTWRHPCYEFELPNCPGCIVVLCVSTFGLGNQYECISEYKYCTNDAVPQFTYGQNMTLHKSCWLSQPGGAYFIEECTELAHNCVNCPEEVRNTDVFVLKEALKDAWEDTTPSRVLKAERTVVCDCN